ncbi:MAG: 23S rRNA (guanosine(2251)-2'-O)-methyltransferase RlmB [Anaerolineae bacterium]|nr:23S rRNA (guanosine(2251)-2'-O)-methyltransferase RlmB [Anaerolineae bacterium]MCB9143581.1 23S rRNA (guanosine(2251)-2'-O)-methyltransferase RlmB [Anaerolineales bacterium]MCB0231971.1 23S rRNA (guanosine(2251)-2'-O)-methyltransferase RlmB [Anaerolineae bacterium]MCB0235285.1 23S rRNA (guanosine(2251)-2'-O)-methyltransferase RlmB [Anaerolineae bacterium]MCB0243760.1 23S rRNA (guanosine(2251)-2'-O)-methyltransferase RlmB [Anaerolineae bacterium]
MAPIDILYGRQAVHEALRARRRHFYSLSLASGVKQIGIVADIQTLAREVNCRVQQVDRAQFDKMLPGANHQGVALESSPYPYSNLGEVFAHARSQDEPPFLLLLDHLEDPQNVGTLLRTAEAVGVHGVFLPDRRAVGITPAVSNSSAGAVEHLRVVHVTNIARTLADFKQRGVWVAGLDNQPEAKDLLQSDFTGKLALVIGAESSGLSRLTRETCDWLVRIPLSGKIESLNASVAGSAALIVANSARKAGKQEKNQEAFQ